MYRWIIDWGVFCLIVVVTLGVSPFVIDTRPTFGGRSLSDGYTPNFQYSAPVQRQNPRDIAPIGWRSTMLNNVPSATLSLPSHPDIRELSFTCDNSQMVMRVTVWPNGRPVQKVAVGTDADAPDATINLSIYSVDPMTGSYAKGDEVLQFYRRLSDMVEQASSDEISVHFISPRLKLAYLTNFQGFKRAATSVANCVPRQSEDTFAKPVAASGAVSDRWEYAGRSARIFFQREDSIWKDSQGQQLLDSISFACQDKPTLSVAGAFVGELTGDKSIPFSVTMPHTIAFKFVADDGADLNLSGSCTNGDGSPVCFVAITRSQIDFFTKTSSLKVIAADQKLVTVLFGSSNAVRKVLPACGRTTQTAKTSTQQLVSNAVVTVDSRSPAASVSTIPMQAGDISIKENLNVRADPSITSAVVLSLTKGSRVVVRPSLDKDWSEAFSNGKSVGFVKNSALALASQTLSASAVIQSAPVTGKPSPSTSQTKLTAASGPVPTQRSPPTSGCEKIWAPKLSVALQQRSEANQSAADPMKFGVLGYALEPKERKCTRVRLNIASASGIRDALLACPQLSTPELLASARYREDTLARGLSGQECN